MRAIVERLTVAGYTVWRPTDRGRGVAFVGRGPQRPRREVLAACTGLDLPAAWARQVHGSASVEATAGSNGEADAITTSRRNLALAVSTADCVPVALLASRRIAVVHAGWRGIVAGVVPTALRVFDSAREPPTAWIGPAIGPCCYEVGEEVAERVVAASGRAEVRQSRAQGERPHLDLVEAVAAQLERSGIERIARVPCCTRCDEDFHSFRRDGEGAGRNLAFAWLPDNP